MQTSNFLHLLPFFLYHHKDRISTDINLLSVPSDLFPSDFYLLSSPAIGFRQVPFQKCSMGFNEVQGFAFKIVQGCAFKVFKMVQGCAFKVFKMVQGCAFKIVQGWMLQVFRSPQVTFSNLSNFCDYFIL